MDRQYHFLRRYLITLAKNIYLVITHLTFQKFFLQSNRGSFILFFHFNRTLKRLFNFRLFCLCFFFTRTCRCPELPESFFRNRELRSADPRRRWRGSTRSARTCSGCRPCPSTSPCDSGCWWRPSVGPSWRWTAKASSNCRLPKMPEMILNWKF